MIDHLTTRIGDRVRKVGGDYTFDGVIMSVFYKRSGVARFVVENDGGLLHIFSAQNLTADDRTAELIDGLPPEYGR